MKKIGNLIDLYDLFVLVGLILLTYGLWMVSIPLAIGVCGGILMAFGLFGAWIKGRKGEK